jgi:L-malate glycosyltransferase
MRIGISGPFNPNVVFDYLSDESKLKVESINENASAINSLVRYLLGTGNSVVIFTGNMAVSENSVLYGDKITIYIVGLKVKWRYLSFYAFMYITSYRIWKYISKYIHDIDILHVHWTYDFAYASSKFVDVIPVVCTVRDWAPYIYKTVKTIKLRILWMQKKYISKKVLDNKKINFISNSDYTRQRILSVYPNYYVPIVFNSIDDKYILIKRELYPKVITFVSISPSIDDIRKNCNTLVLAFSKFRTKYPCAKLILIGRVNFRGVLYKEWEKNGLLDNIEFTGFINHCELMRVLDNVSCLVHPSLEETFGNIFLEAMSRRVPIIGGEKSGAVPIVLKNGECGCLCDVTNVASLVNAMFRVIEDSAYKRQLVENSTNVLINEYSGSIIAQKHLDIYKSILDLY